MKNSEVKDEFKAKGLDKAKEKLLYENLPEDEKKMYNRFQENIRIERSIEYTAKAEAKLEEKLKIASNLKKFGLSNADIASNTGLDVKDIENL